jgi:hypothetical protein
MYILRALTKCVASISMSMSMSMSIALLPADPDEFNDIIQKSFLSAVRADAGMYSHPLMLVRLLCQWRAMNKPGGGGGGGGSGFRNERVIRDWLDDNNIVRSRIQQLDSTARNIARTVSQVLLRIDRRAATRRGPRYDLKAMLAAHENDSDSGDDLGCLGDGDPVDLMRAPDDYDYSYDEDDNELANEDGNNGAPSELDRLSLEVNLEDATDEEAEEAACRLNMCRLILAWSSDEMVLRQVVKKKPNAEAISTLRLGSGPAVTPAQCMSLFPPDVPHKLRTSGSLMYDGKIRGDLNLTDVLTRMCSVGAFMADLRYDSEAYSDAGWRAEPQIDVAAPIVWIVVKEENALFIAISDPNLEKVLFPIFARGKLADQGMEFGSYHVFGASKVSKSEFKALADFRNSGVFERVLSMTLPKRGHATLTVTGCEPCCRDLQDIFRVPDAEAEAADGSGGGGGGGGGMLPPGIKLQVQDRNQILSFEQAGAEAGGAYFFKDSLLQDIPIGMRLYSSFKNARFKDK